MRLHFLTIFPTEVIYIECFNMFIHSNYNLIFPHRFKFNFDTCFLVSIIKDRSCNHIRSNKRLISGFLMSKNSLFSSFNFQNRSKTLEHDKSEYALSISFKNAENRRDLIKYIICFIGLIIYAISITFEHKSSWCII